jgi:hypothetical protein
MLDESASKPTDENYVVVSKIIYIYDAEKVEENNQMIILPQLYYEASTQQIQDVSTTNDVEAFGRRATVPSSLLTTNSVSDLRSPEEFEHDIIDLRYEKMKFCNRYFCICIVICVIIIVVIFYSR